MRTELLDHGYVELVESWGSDERIVEAARMSTAKGFLGWGGVDPCPECLAAGALSESDGLYKNAAYAMTRADCKVCLGKARKPGDEKLLRFLWENKHATPFEMGGLIVEVQAPIFVFREWHRHRTQSYNELSARYTALPDMFYVPSMERLMAARQSTTNKQSSEGGFDEQEAKQTASVLRTVYATARHAYENLLAAGVAREVARLVIPVSQYSRMRASSNLRNWLAFLTLRMDVKAQWEIRQYANVVGEMVAAKFPRTWELFAEGRR